jgi:membrane protease subunit (stomatin/prohibitin family)
MRAAAVGGVAYAAGKHGANAGEEPDPNAPADDQPEAAADPAPAAPSADQSMEELTKLKGLLDSGVLTQAEFDAQKQKILQSM